MCFTLMWLRDLLVFFVVVFAVLALVRLILSFVLGQPFWPLLAWPPFPGGGPGGLGGLIVGVVNIVIWAFVVIAAIYIVFMLISCLWSFGGGMGSLFPHR